MLIKTKQERILRLVKEAVERDNITEAAACRASLDYEGALTAKIIKELSNESVRNTGR